MSVAARQWAWRVIPGAGLTPSAVIVLLRLVDLCKDDTCYRSDPELAEDCGRLSHDTLSRSRLMLAEKGLIDFQRGAGRRATTYRVLLSETTQNAESEYAKSVVRVRKKRSQPTQNAEADYAEYPPQTTQNACPIRITGSNRIEPDITGSSASAFASLDDPFADDDQTVPETASPEPAQKPARPKRSKASSPESAALDADAKAIVTMVAENLRSRGQEVTTGIPQIAYARARIRKHGVDRCREVWGVVARLRDSEWPARDGIRPCFSDNGWDNLATRAANGYSGGGSYRVPPPGVSVRQEDLPGISPLERARRERAEVEGVSHE